MKRTLITLIFAAALTGVAGAAIAQAPDIRDIRPVVMLLVDTSGSMEWTATDYQYPDCSVGQRSRFHMIIEAMTGSWADADWSCDSNYVPNGPNQRSDGILDVYLDRILFGMMTFDSNYDLRTDSRGMWSYGPDALWNDGNRWDNTTPVTCADGTSPCSGPSGDYINVGARNASADTGALVSIGDGTTTTAEQHNRDIQADIISIQPNGGTPIAGMLDDLGWFLQHDPDIQSDAFRDCRKHYAILLSDGEPNMDKRDYWDGNCTANGLSCPYLTSVDEAAQLCQLDSNGKCGGILDGLYTIGMDLAAAGGLSFLNDVADVGGTTQAFYADDRSTLITALSEALDSISATSTSRTAPAFGGGGISGGTTSAEFNAGFVVGQTGGWQGRLERTRYECNSDHQPVAQNLDNTDRFHDLLNAQGSRTLYTVVPSRVANYASHLIGSIPDAPNPIPYANNNAGSSGGGGKRGGGGLPAVCRTTTTGGGGSSSNGNGNGNGNGNNNTGTNHVAESGLTLSPFSRNNSAISTQLLGVSTQAERDAAIDWVRGDAGRPTRLGAIYHSSPVIVGPPTMDIPDESYNLFRQRTDVANRPTVLYVGSNDGLLHAFLAQDWEDPSTGASMTAGTELWGFVPTLLMQKIPAAMAGNQFMVDGTAVVRDIFFRRQPGQQPSADLYHTVLIMGMRGGGAGYIALDVTDPFNPQFMWQFADGDTMGATMGTPAMGQILVELPDPAGGSGLYREERAIVLLPAGSAVDVTSTTPNGKCGAPEDLNGDGNYDKPIGCPGQGRGTPPVNNGTTQARDNQKCWDSRGRDLYFVDPATGQLVTLLNDTVFNAPLTGGFSLFTGDTGTIATRAFFTDADGVLWRVDFSNPDYSQWDAEPMFDLYHSTGSGVYCGSSADAAAGYPKDCEPTAMDAQPSYFAPVVTSDSDGRVTVIVGTGNLDQLDDPLSVNRVISITEVLTFGSDGQPQTYQIGGKTYTAKWRLNWEIQLDRGEQVTGPIQLFGGYAYFATFRAADTSTNACAFGTSELWGVDYLRNPKTQSCQSLDETHCSGNLCTTDTCPAADIQQPLGAFAGSGSTLSMKYYNPPVQNALILGVGITQRQTCSQFGTITDPYLAYFRQRAVTQQGTGGFQLTAQLSGGGQARQGGSIPNVTMDLQPPAPYTQILGWASTL